MAPRSSNRRLVTYGNQLGVSGRAAAAGHAAERQSVMCKSKIMKREYIDILIDQNLNGEKERVVELFTSDEIFELSWFEEPVAYQDLRGCAEVRRALDTRISGQIIGVDGNTETLYPRS